MGTQYLLVKEFIEALNKKDFAVIERLLDDNHRLIVNETVYTGKSEAINYWKKAFAVQERFTITPTHVVEGGNLVLFIGVINDCNPSHTKEECWILVKATIAEGVLTEWEHKTEKTVR